MLKQQQHCSEYEYLLKDQILISAWQVIKHGTNDDYIQEDKLKQWINRVVAGKQRSQQLASVDIYQQISIYIKQIHDLNKSSITNVMFKFQQAVEFYGWLIDKFGAKPSQGQSQDKLGEHNVNNQKSQKEDISQQQHQKGKYQNDEEQIDPQTNEQEAKLNNNPQNISNQNNIQNIGSQLYQSNEQQQQQHENEFEDKNSKNADQQQVVDIKKQSDKLDKNYRQYLNIIFDHYCRMSYSTGTDPTFEQIKQKVQVMNINKFMIFCKDFNIIKLNLVNRNNIVQIFKKNSEFYKDIHFQQFILILYKISSLVYGNNCQLNVGDNSKQFQQLLIHLEINNSNAFKKKMETLNIPYRMKCQNLQNSENKNESEQKKVLRVSKKIGSKPRIVNGKLQNEIKQQIENRKQIRSENKLAGKQKIGVKNKEIRKYRSSIKNIIKINNMQLNTIQLKQQGRSTQNVKKIPSLPSSSTKPYVQKLKIQNNSDHTVPIGYAQIYKMKQLGKNANIQTRMKLNYIVEQAKKLVGGLDKNHYQNHYEPSKKTSTYILPNPYEDFKQWENRKSKNFIQRFSDQEIGQSDYSNYSQKDLNSQKPQQNVMGRRIYTPHGHSYLQKKKKISQCEDDLKDIIGEDSDKDQYLQQHLKREMKSKHISKRIQKKIKEFQLKSMH